MVLSNAQWFANPGVVYEIDNSCRFNDDDSAYTSKTPSASNRDIWTFSSWVKRGNLGSAQHLFSAGADNSNATLIAFGAADDFRYEHVDGGANTDQVISTQKFRDPSAWYHFVCAVDTTNATEANRVRLYVNGTEITALGTANYPAQNVDTDVGAAVEHTVGARPGNDQEIDGYMAEVVYIDGSQLTPSSFGETNTTTGQWVPKSVSGLTFGTEGFHLDFAVAPGTGNGAGTDVSGNANHFTDSGLAANDQMSDSPTDNYATINPLYFGSTVTSDVTFSEGNLKAVNGNSGNRLNFFTSGMPTTGKWAWKVKILGATLGGNNVITFGFGSPGITPPTDGNATSGQWNTMVTQTECGYSDDIDYIFSGGTPTEHYAGATDSAQNDVFEWLVDRDAGTVQLKRNGSNRGGLLSSLPDDEILVPFVSTYAQEYVITTDYTPSDSSYDVLSTANLPDPTIADPSAYFQTTLYTGTGSSLAVNQDGNSTFEPDFVWIKNRDAADAHILTDSVRGVTKVINSNTSNSETTDADTLTAFDSDGFTVGADVKVNTSTEKYVAWQWIEGSTPGFDVVTWTGNVTNRTISHSLGAVPAFMVVKNLGDTDNWVVYHQANTAAPETDYLQLNTNAATADSNAFWNDTAPTSSVFTVGINGGVNDGSQEIIGYLWAEVEGFSKFGKYTGNGSTDGPFVYCGFRPAYLLWKRTDSTEEWRLFDSVRDIDNPVDFRIEVNGSGAEITSTGTPTDFLSNGFKVRNADGGWNASGANYIFAAFAETPFKTANAR